MLNRFAVRCIEFYQKHISPKKGYVCAHKYYYGGDSCSEYMKKSIVELGIVRAAVLFAVRLKECKKAYMYIEQEKSNAESCSDRVYGVVHGKKCEYACEICSFYGVVIAGFCLFYDNN